MNDAMTQPYPDPTNREQLVRVLAAAHGNADDPDELECCRADLDAITDAGYQIVPKVELEGLKMDAAEWRSKGLCSACNQWWLDGQALDKENG